MQKLLRAFFLGAVFSLGVLAVPAMASLALFTGPSGSNPIQFPAALADLNKLINTLNGEVTGYLALNNSTLEQGEVAFLNPASTVANGGIATSVTSLGPNGSHTTIQGWFVWVDSAGNVRYTPGW